MNQPPTATTVQEPGPATLRLDAVAGLTAAAVVLPKAMAYATVAGLPVAVGLYTAFVPMVIYALLGSWRVLSVSSTTTLAILAGTQLGLAVPDGDPGKLVTATATLTANGSIGDASCVDDDLPSSTRVETAVPAPGQGLYYVIRADGVGMAPGTYDDPDGTGIAHTRDDDVGTEGGNGCGDLP